MFLLVLHVFNVPHHVLGPDHCHPYNDGDSYFPTPVGLGTLIVAHLSP